MGEYIFRFPAGTPELTAGGLAAYLGPRKHRGIGRTVMITHHAARPRLGMPESFHVELYGRIIAQITPEGWVYFPATGDTHLATREWLARIVADNGIGTSVFRIRRHAGDPPGHGPLVIGGDRDRPVEGRSYPVNDAKRRKREQLAAFGEAAESSDLASYWRATAR